jgi:hypothetical protein
LVKLFPPCVPHLLHGYVILTIQMTEGMDLSFFNHRWRYSITQNSMTKYCITARSVWCQVLRHFLFHVWKHSSSAVRSKTWTTYPTFKINYIKPIPVHSKPNSIVMWIKLYNILQLQFWRLQAITSLVPVDICPGFSEATLIHTFFPSLKWNPASAFTVAFYIYDLLFSVVPYEVIPEF